MPEKVKSLNLEKEKGFLYFLDRQGDLYKVKMSRKGRKKEAHAPKKEFVMKTDIKKEPNYLYYINKEGEVFKSPMQRGK